MKKIKINKDVSVSYRDNSDDLLVKYLSETPSEEIRIFLNEKVLKKEYEEIKEMNIDGDDDDPFSAISNLYNHFMKYIDLFPFITHIDIDDLLRSFDIGLSFSMFEGLLEYPNFYKIDIIHSEWFTIQYDATYISASISIIPKKKLMRLYKTNKGVVMKSFNKLVDNDLSKLEDLDSIMEEWDCIYEI